MDYNKKTIYIAIAAFNEIFIEQTIKSAMSMAQFPDRLRFGVFSLNSDGRIFNSLQKENVKILNAQYEHLLGVCFSRINALSFFNNEDFFMQIDAHMLFGKYWDSELIKSYYDIVQNEKCEHPLITTRVPWWTSGKNNEILYYDPNKKIKQPILYIDKNSYKHTNIPDIIGADPFTEWGNNLYKEHFAFSAHFAFTSSSFIYDIMPDMNLMFVGEEITTSLRAWTRGYRIFSIPKNIVWHYNKKLNPIKNNPSLYKNDRLNIQTSIFYKEKDIVARKRVKEILTGEILGYWGAPDLESLKKYENYVGVDFKEFYKQREKIFNNFD